MGFSDNGAALRQFLDKFKHTIDAGSRIEMIMDVEDAVRFNVSLSNICRL